MQSAVDDLFPGAVLLGRYRLEETLGGGGFGVVMRAHDAVLDQAVAIKILRREGDGGADAERFMREARLVASLRSEHVVKVYDLGVLPAGMPYMVMELLRGTDLGKLVKSSGKLAPQVAVDYVLQACDALAEAHALGIVHRDVKPSNLIVTTRPDRTELVKVLDFGIAKAPKMTDLALTQTSSLLGTPAFMSPEQIRSARTVDARTDIWSLGTVLYQLVEGRLPFQTETVAEQVAAVMTREHLPLVAAPELAQIVARCLAKDPAQRYADIAELAVALAHHTNRRSARAMVAQIQSTLGATRTASTAGVTAPARGRRIILLLAIVGAAIGAAIALAFATKAPEADPAPAAAPVAADAAPALPPPADAAPPPVDAAPPPVDAAPPPVDAAPPARPIRPIRKPPPSPPPPPPKPKCDPMASLRGC